MPSLDIHILHESIQDVSAPRPALLPLFRSTNQVRLLTALVLGGAREWTVGELADHTGIPQPSVSREVRALRDMGLLRPAQLRARSGFSTDPDSPLWPDLSSLILKAMGPQAVVSRELSRVAGIDEAYIYGSWARRFHGEPGPTPADVDVLVIGRPDVNEVRAATERASAELRLDVSPTVLTPTEWSDTASGFLVHVRESPLVALDVPEIEGR